VINKQERGDKSFQIPTRPLTTSFLILALSSRQSIPLAGLNMTNPLSRHSSLPPEDWDHPEPSTIDHHHSTTVSATASAAAPSRVVFPSSQGGCDDNDASVPPEGGRSGKRTLSELLKLHAEKGTNVHFTTEEATRLEETLGRWINSCSSPYEGDDDFFPRTPDDSIVLVHRSSTFHCIVGRPPHGQNESIALES